MIGYNKLALALAFQCGIQFEAVISLMPALFVPEELICPPSSHCPPTTVPSLLGLPPLQTTHTLSLCLDSILPHWKMHLLLLLLLRHQLLFLLSQPPPNRPGLFRSQIKRQILLLLVEQAQLRSLVCIDHGKDFGDGFAEVVTMNEVSFGLICVQGR